MNPRISLSDLVAMSCYVVKDVVGYFGRDGTTTSAMLSRYDGRVDKRPEMRRKLLRLIRFVPTPVPKSLCTILRVLPNVGL